MELVPNGTCSSLDGLLFGSFSKFLVNGQRSKFTEVFQQEQDP